MRLTTAFALLALLPISASFAPTRPQHHRTRSIALAASSESPSSSSQPSGTKNDNSNEWQWNEWAEEHVVVTSKLSVRSPLEEERGKGGVHAHESISALEVMARIPRALVLSTADMTPKAMAAAAEATEFSWATDLTAATLVALHPSDDDEENTNMAAAKQSWIQSWKAGGWATDGADLGPPEADWGAKCVTGSLLSTGSDNDHNIFAKFRFPCHPVVHRAGLGLAMLTGTPDDDAAAREALLRRGRAFRAMRDALLPLVETPTERKGSARERRAWDVADILSRVLSRATILELDNESSFCIVPLHDRLDHSSSENSKLVASSDDQEVLLVATRDISVGEAITRNYEAAPQLDADTSDGALRLLLQFGLPPNAWTAN